MQIDHTKNIIEVKDVSFSFKKDNVLRNVSLNIHKGDYIGITGPNGAGKTTLLKIMIGLIRPSLGTVHLFGRDVTLFKDWAKIGYVPQKATNFDPKFPATIEEVVLMGRYKKRGLLRSITKEDKEKAATAIEHVGLTDVKDRLVGELSGGQQQRVFIARALAGEPEIIFLDEPITGMDTQAQEELYTLLKKMNTELELTLVLVSHDVVRLTKEVMHIVCVNHTMECFESPEDLLKKEAAGLMAYR